MDTHFLSQLVFSILILAPGVVLLAGLAFLGLLMLLEKALFGRDSNVTLVTAQAAQLSAERTAVQLLGRQLSASVTLLKAAGGDWRMSGNASR